MRTSLGRWGARRRPVRRTTAVDVVFLGLSLPLEKARPLLDADYRPPAKLGSVLAACRDGATRIGIVDGFYETVPAVWHKEILYALSRGVEVYGAASMGALRAAELDGLGMVGVGQVYRWYRDGVLVADDEVSLMHGPELGGYRALSVALVDIRATLDVAVRQGVVTDAVRTRLIAEARRRHYPERHYEDLLAACVDDELERTRLRDWVTAHAVSQKRLDAVELLQTMASTRRGAYRVTVPFEQTWNWTTLLAELVRRDEGPTASSGSPSGEAEHPFHRPHRPSGHLVPEEIADPGPQSQPPR